MFAMGASPLELVAESTNQHYLYRVLKDTRKPRNDLDRINSTNGIHLSKITCKSYSYVIYLLIGLTRHDRRTRHTGEQGINSSKGSTGEYGATRLLGAMGPPGSCAGNHSSTRPFESK